MIPWSSPRPEAALLREALCALGAPRPALAARVGRVEDWALLLELARRHAVAEALWSALVLRGLEGAVPPGPRGQLAEEHAGAAARNALLLAEAGALQAALEAEGLPSLVLKGPALLVAHYPGPGARHVADLDLLVRPADLARAAAVARRRGAAPSPHALDHAGEPAEGAHHLPALETADGVLLELHHQLPGAEHGAPGAEAVLARSRRVAWQGRTLRVPAAADLAGMLCLHVFEHHRGEARFLPRHLADLAVLVGAGATTWAEVEAHWGPARREGLAASRALLEAPARFRRGGALRRELAALREVLARGGRPGRPGALRVLFPARRFMAERYGFAEASPWLPLVYAWRPVAALLGFVRRVAGR